jgi:hypothetical protein
MADPFTVDCGGSTRVKLFSNNSKLDTLLDDDGTGVHSADLRDRYTSMKIVFMDKLGETKTLGPFALGNLDVVIDSEGNQKARVANAAGMNSRLELSGTGGDEPIIEGKQAKGQGRRYVVSNAGAIQKVKFGNNPAYDRATAVTDVNRLPSVYATVILT